MWGGGELNTPTRGNSPHQACGCTGEPSLKTTALAPPLQRKTAGPDRGGTVPCHLPRSQKKPAAGFTASSWPPPAPPFPHLASSSTSQRSPSEGVSWCGRNKVSQARGLQTTEMYCLWLLETTSLRSRCREGRSPGGCEGGCVPGLSQLLVSPETLSVPWLRDTSL